MILKVKKITNNAKIPYYASEKSSGLDLMANIVEKVIIKSKEKFLVPTGISIALPEGCEGQVRPRSGLASKYGITVVNSPGTIDEDYRGEVKVCLINHSNEDFVLEPGMRIAQLVVCPFIKVDVKEVDELDITSRGEGGFGSTGV